jgi:hypothetical protein
MRICVLLLSLIGAALPVGISTAWAQPAPAAPRGAPAPRDVIGALLEQHARQAPGDEDEPDTASAPRTEPEAEPPVAAPYGARPYATTPRPHLNAPVNIGETGRSPGAPLSPANIAYDARIRSSFAAAQEYQGPLDGGWTLSAAGQDLYSLQLVDRRDRLEGVWRDVRRKGALNGSGLVDDIQRQGSEVTLRFAVRPGAPVSVATLHPSGDGRWAGDFSEGGDRRQVILRRTGL